MIFLAIPLATWNLEAGDAGLTAAGDTLQWAWSAAPTAGPGASGIGSPSWSTVPDGQYLNDADDSVIVDLPDLSLASRPTLRVEHWYAVLPGDDAVVEIDTGGGFGLLTPDGGYPAPGGFVGASAGWRTSVFSLPPAVAPRVRFRLVADPLVAEAGWYLRGLDVFDGDISPPQIAAVVVPDDTQDVSGPYAIELEVSDDVAVVEVEVTYAFDGVPGGSVPMVEGPVGVYRAGIPAPPTPGTVVTWFASASDAEQQARYPEAEDASFRVFLAAPTDLVASDLPARAVANEVYLSWTPPVSPHPVLRYVVTERGVEPLEFDDAEALWALQPDTAQTFEVRALYDVGLGDPSEALQLSVEVPELVSLQPDQVFAGETAWVAVQGRSLYLLDGVGGMDLGPGTVVREWSVSDVDSARALVEIAPDAAVGTRHVRVEGTQGAFGYADAFRVGDPADAPRIVAVSPATLVQGVEATLVLTASVPFAADGGTEVLLDGGDDLVSTGPVMLQGNTATVDVAVSTRARPGVRTLLLDDGQRLWTAELEVSEYVSPPQRSCSAVPHGPATLSLGGAALLLALGRRRSTR